MKRKNKKRRNKEKIPTITMPDEFEKQLEALMVTDRRTINSSESTPIELDYFKKKYPQFSSIISAMKKPGILKYFFRPRFTISNFDEFMDVDSGYKFVLVIGYENARIRSRIAYRAPFTL